LCGGQYFPKAQTFGQGIKILENLACPPRGDAYVRSLLRHGARVIIARNASSAWITVLLATALRNRGALVVVERVDDLGQCVVSLQRY